MRGKNLVQLIKTLSLLSRPQGTTRKELAGALNISNRSVSRTIRTVENIGIPIYDESIPFEKEKRWRIESSYLERLPNLSLPKLALSFPEIISLCMLAGESVVFKETEIDRHITTAIAKLMVFVPEKTRNELIQLKRIFISKTIGSKTYAGKEYIISTLTESMLNRTACRITYHAFYKDEIEDKEVGPLHFYEHNGGLYLFAMNLKNKSIHSYAVERIKQIKLLNCDIKYPENFDPIEKLNSAFDLTHGDPVSVKIRFSKNEARYIREKIWATDQYVIENPDGTITLSMTTSGYRDVKRWVMSFGKQAQLLEPEQMKKEIKEELKDVLKRM
ncbi:MAG: WYL domain-containing transcriptional regulator [Desulfobacterales bacterium]|nr:WYL domain-containing transcriptional regulator [Desulfobacterales bacterium]